MSWIRNTPIFIYCLFTSALADFFVFHFPSHIVIRFPYIPACPTSFMSWPHCTITRGHGWITFVQVNTVDWWHWNVWFNKKFRYGRSHFFLWICKLRLLCSVLTIIFTIIFTIMFSAHATVIFRIFVFGSQSPFLARICCAIFAPSCTIRITVVTITVIPWRSISAAYINR